MDIKEAYRIMQSEWVELYGIKVGSRLKVVRENRTDELGSDSWPHVQREFDKYGTSVEVTHIHYDAISVTTPTGAVWKMPFFVLEFIENPEPPKPEKMITVCGKEYSESMLDKMAKQYVAD